ncbi:hypothetical protein, partial [Pseudomonas sp. AH2 (2023)]|uniref:hypothetical protein n=1 Tax=Pseudomonas sp. AH2 (2023) TaxID=3048599 RepID=UPI002B225E9D
LLGVLVSAAPAGGAAAAATTLVGAPARCFIACLGLVGLSGLGVFDRIRRICCFSDRRYVSGLVPAKLRGFLLLRWHK